MFLKTTGKPLVASLMLPALASTIRAEEGGSGHYLPVSMPAAMSLRFTSNATFDIGTDPDSPVSLDCFDQAPFAFNGIIGKTESNYLKK